MIGIKIRFLLELLKHAQWNYNTKHELDRQNTSYKVTYSSTTHHFEMHPFKIVNLKSENVINKYINLILKKEKTSQTLLCFPKTDYCCFSKKNRILLHSLPHPQIIFIQSLIFQFALWKTLNGISIYESLKHHMWWQVRMLVLVNLSCTIKVKHSDSILRE